MGGTCAPARGKSTTHVRTRTASSPNGMHLERHFANIPTSRPAKACCAVRMAVGTHVENIASGGAPELSVVLNRDPEECWGTRQDTVTHWAFLGFWDAQELNSSPHKREGSENQYFGTCVSIVNLSDHALCNYSSNRFESYGKCLLFSSCS